MNPRELAERRAFDLRVLSDMRCPMFDFEAYRTTADLQHRRSQVTDPTAGATVTAYRWIFRIRTHISQTQFAPVTEIGVSTDVPDYPRNPPSTWILSNHVPWSPHFRKDAPVCIGPELWAPTGGYIVLGELAINIAHLLNWDEAGRGPGYAGWNREAIQYHQKAYGGKPIDQRLRYPVLPSWLSGEPTNQLSFQVVPDGRPDPGFQADPGFRIQR
jgi:hypothetical protein